MALKTDYKDYIASGNKKVKAVPLGNNIYEVSDSTDYSQVGDSIGADDINAITTEVNSISTDLGTKANASDLGTQVTYSLSGTTLTITTK